MRKSDILACLQVLYEKVIVRWKALGLTTFCIQSDNGEFKSDAIERYLHSVGGTRKVCCAYTPELMAVIERLWGTIRNMASAMMIQAGLSEPYWELAQAYACLIYNNIPPTEMVLGVQPQ